MATVFLQFREGHEMRKAFRGRANYCSEGDDATESENKDQECEAAKGKALTVHWALCNTSSVLECEMREENDVK